MKIAHMPTSAGAQKFEKKVNYENVQRNSTKEFVVAEYDGQGRDLRAYRLCQVVSLESPKEEKRSSSSLCFVFFIVSCNSVVERAFFVEIPTTFEA